MKSMTFSHLNVDDYKAQFKDTSAMHLLLDVRTIEEFEEARIPGAINIPLDELSERVEEVIDIAQKQPIVIVCRTGVRSIMGAQILRFGGIQDVEIFNLDEGTMGWAQRRLPLESDF